MSHAAAPGLRVSDESPRGSIALELIRELGEELIERYGREGSGPFEPGQVEREGGFFVVAWFGDQPVGCGALRPMTPEIGEVKRMFVRRAYRGRGLSRRILAELEERGARHGYQRLQLETGLLQHEAMALYESAGYTRIPCFGAYAEDPISVCYSKEFTR